MITWMKGLKCKFKSCRLKKKIEKSDINQLERVEDVCEDSRSVKGSEWKKSISGREGGLV